MNLIIKSNYTPFKLIVGLLFIFITFSFGKLQIISTVTIPIIIASLFFLSKKGKIALDDFYKLIFYTLIFSSISSGHIFKIILIALIFFLTLSKKKLKYKHYYEKLTLLFFLLITINFALFSPHFKGLDILIYFFLIPLLFILLKKKNVLISVNTTIKAFVLSCFTQSLLLVVLNLINGTLIKKTNPLFSILIDLHHVYYGMFLAISIILISYSWINSRKKIFSTYWDLLLVLFHTVILLYIGARTSILATGIVLFILFFKKTNYTLIKKLTVTILLMSIAVFLIVKSPRFKQGLNEVEKVTTIIKNNDKEALVKESWKNIPMRYLTYKYTFSELKKHWVLGIGMQNVVDKISDKIVDDGYIYFLPKNTHNQYLHFFIGMGIFGFSFFIFLLLKFAINHDNNLYVLLFLLIVMLTESILVRGKGILLFTFFNLLFVNRKIWND